MRSTTNLSLACGLVLLLSGVAIGNAVQKGNARARAIIVERFPAWDQIVMVEAELRAIQSESPEARSGFRLLRNAIGNFVEFTSRRMAASARLEAEDERLGLLLVKVRERQEKGCWSPGTCRDDRDRLHVIRSRLRARGRLEKQCKYIHAQLALQDCVLSAVQDWLSSHSLGGSHLLPAEEVSSSGPAMRQEIRGVLAAHKDELLRAMATCRKRRKTASCDRAGSGAWAGLRKLLAENRHTLGIDS